ncbi:MAG: FG-GAP repeat protein [Natronospirillum sp.]|uniref:hypothetical protein n=1 Tax=Natronospirillum sp. TaxID=2812955 RepID=UPI0025F59594|nr:hypothetical protein [Natronospirillum sp.]MCH8552426.1 FG-GAP repeat protein [Natronospirillum sp.]
MTKGLESAVTSVDTQRNICKRIVLCGLMVFGMAACSSDNDEVAIHTVSLEIGANGSIDPGSAQEVEEGEAVQFELLPDSDYEIDQIEGCKGALDDTTYTTDAISEDCTVTVSFKLIPPEAPALSLTPTAIKTFSFSWVDVSGESEYRLLENPDGESGYSEVATLPADTTEHDLEVFLPGRINASYILQACNSGGCSDSSAVHVSGTLAEAVGYFKASNTREGDRFGYSVALSGDGNTMAVGAHRENSDATGINGDQDNNDASNSGAVYVFAKTDGNWSQQAYVKASNTSEEDFFGASVALSADGDTLVVGAPEENSNATGIGGHQHNSNAVDSGAVYVFVRNNDTWSQQAYVKASTTESGNRFGISVALSDDGHTLAAAAHQEDGGTVYIFNRIGTFWFEQTHVKASNASGGDEFGWRIALSGDGNTLAVGARNEDSDATGVDGDEGNSNAGNSGAAYVFARSDGDWSQQAYIKASNTNSSDLFGYSVALSRNGDTLAVGARNESSDATGVGGDQDNQNMPENGAVYVYSRSGTDWSQQAYIKSSTATNGGFFGFAVALSDDGNTLVVGKPFDGTQSIGVGGLSFPAGGGGAAEVFTRDNGIWSYETIVKASNTAAAQFGWSLALSGDGETLAVGAPHEDSNATGVGGNLNDNTAENSGAVYLY